MSRIEVECKEAGMGIRTCESKSVVIYLKELLCFRELLLQVEDFKNLGLNL